MTYQDMMNKNFSRQRKQMTAEFLKDQNSLPEKLPLYLIQNIELPLRRLKVAVLELPLPLPLLQTAIMEISAILKA